MSPSGGRGWLIALVALAAVFPLGWLLAPAVWPARSHMPAVASRLNLPVVLITVAGLRADRLQPGAHAARTPRLDRLAEHGVVFRTCWTQSNQTAAAGAALITGCCPQRTGVRRDGQSLRAGQETLGKLFAAAGFRTAAVVSTPELLGAGLQPGFGAWQALPLAAAREVVDEGLRQIDAAPDDPWLLWLDFSDLLAPYGGAALPTAAFAPDAPAGFGSAPGDYDLDDADLAARGWGPRELAWLAARYDAALGQLDAEIGRLLDGLAARNALETSIVCLAGLRGERLDERPPRRFVHGIDLFEPSLAVPLIVRLPAQEFRGMQVTRPAQLIDVGPTLADFALRQRWERAQGRSLKPTLEVQTAVNKAVFAEGLVETVPGAPIEAEAVRVTTGKSMVKTIVGADGALLGAWRFPEDPQETQSLPLQRQQLELLVKQWQTALGEQAVCVKAAR